jgi:hypothetical protein
MIDGVTEIGRCYRMEMNVGINLMRISRQSSPIRIMTNETQLENMEYFSCSNSIVTNGARN